MRRVTLFVEDHAHQGFLAALLSRFEEEYELSVDLDWRNVRRGHPSVVRELKQYLRDLQGWSTSPPDLLVVATDANCEGVKKRRKELESVVPEGLKKLVVYALPDPHIERWLLLDSAAFKQVFGRGCDAPDRKCERKRYKEMLADAIRKTGTKPILGGIESFSDIVKVIDLERVIREDRSLKDLVHGLRAAFMEWRETTPPS